MIRFLFLALLFTSPALAQDTVVVTATPDGLRLDVPTNAPVGDAPAALLTYTPRGEWHLQVLSPGDVPTRKTARGIAAPPAPPRPPSPPTRPWLGTDIGASDAGIVTYSIRGRVPADGLDAVLVQLSETDALRSLDSTSHADGATVEAVFSFDSTTEWAAWHARPETEALLAPLADAETALRVHR